MITRVLLIFSSLFGLLLGMGLIAGGSYIQRNHDFVSNLAAKIDLTSMPQAEQLKKDMFEKIRESEIVQTITNVFIVTGVIIGVISALGLASAITVMAAVLIVYICTSVLLILAFLTVVILLTGAKSVIEKPILDKMVAWQNSNFISVVALLNDRTNEGVFPTLILNAIQVQLRCCGMRTVGDIGDSPSWQSSPRNMLDALKLKLIEIRKAGVLPPDENGIVFVQEDMTPAWVKNRMPPNTTLPAGARLPQELPEGITIPKSFNITADMLGNASAIDILFNDSLVLRTPLSCCMLKDTSSMSFIVDAKQLMTSLVDPNCPFQALNDTRVHNDTCYKIMEKDIRNYAAPLILSGILLGLMMSCNLTLAIQLLVCSVLGCCCC